MLLILILFGCPPPKAQKKMPRIFLLSNTLEAGIEPSFIITDDFNRNQMLDLSLLTAEGILFHFTKGMEMDHSTNNWFTKQDEAPFVSLPKIIIRTDTKILLFSITKTKLYRYF